MLQLNAAGKLVQGVQVLQKVQVALEGGSGSGRERSLTSFEMTARYIPLSFRADARNLSPECDLKKTQTAPLPRRHVDFSIVEELEKSGFIDSVYKEYIELKYLLSVSRRTKTTDL